MFAHILQRFQRDSMNMASQLTLLYTLIRTIYIITGAIVLLLPHQQVHAGQVEFVPPKRSWKRARTGYAPSAVQCPSVAPSIRTATTLSVNETAWLKARQPNTVWALRDFLRRANITGFDTDAYIGNSADENTLPSIGIAISGGGYRAMMNGAGAIAAFDNRTTNSTDQGKLGGILQASTYISGLSGGSWLVGSLYAQNFPSVQEVITGTSGDLGTLWQFSDSILKGPADLSVTQYYDNIFDDVNGKEAAGFNTTITDYWGRGLSFQYINASDGGPSETFSSVANDPDFLAANTPMPIIIADERAPDQLMIPSNATIFEFNPWEMGSYDPTIRAFAPLKYIGSNFSGGTLLDREACITGFDNTGFVIGTSSSLFNTFYLQINNTEASQRVKDSISHMLLKYGQANSDISQWPNPFYGFQNETNENAASKILSLVDGGEDLQNIPFHPLIQPLRRVDVIFAVDGSADTSSPGANWPNGTAVVATYRRSLLDSSDVGFPPVPDQNTFVNLGLNARPTFFGCNASNLTEPSPLIIYLPNRPYSYSSNVSTFDLSYNNSERNSIIQNGYNVATVGNGTLDPQWPACVGCAILLRSFNRTRVAIPGICTQCFDRYCWNGTVNSTIPVSYQPTNLIKSSGGSSLPNPVSFVIAAVLLGWLILFL
ncbi:lysophospholipase catalytic domain-containing protein [Leptodontidium sp. MPI-SDFR-AT-0119]|nr:lysophospholipase catalytic domain-containing protein [Leptodontidium sp. MPI-SDFR-AT-0119]